jgi:hypothetical protein
MQSVLPLNISIKYWVYTLVGLFVMTTLLVINLPNIMTLVQFLRGLQSLYWGRLRDVVRNRSREEENEDEEDESGDESNDEEFEMEELGGEERGERIGGEV